MGMCRMVIVTVPTMSVVSVSMAIVMTVTMIMAMTVIIVPVAMIVFGRLFRKFPKASKCTGQLS